MEERRPPAPEADGIIEGRNAVIEALRAGTAIDKIYLQKGETDKTLGHIASKARSAGAVVVEADKRKLDAMSATHSHQGAVAVAAAAPIMPQRHTKMKMGSRMMLTAAPARVAAMANRGLPSERMMGLRAWPST